jgi:hypothetical protein
MDLVTILACYGAVVSTAAILWNIYEYRRKRPNLKVEANYGLIAGLGASQPTVTITMVNTGKEPLTVVASGFRLDTNSEENVAVVVDPTLPTELAQGQSHTTFANYDGITAHKILYAWARDATGRKYRSKKRPLRA